MFFKKDCLEKLINRKIKKIDTNKFNEFIKDEVVLITGGGGSIGSELAREIYKLVPKKLIIFDIYENNAYDIQTELKNTYYKTLNSETELVTIIGSVYNYNRVNEIFEKYKPSIVFHTAAYKHVPLMEENAKEAVRTNIIGTKLVSQAANQYKTKKMILISSDKAVHPTSVMGISKRLSEQIVINENLASETIFSVVRFGNVLNSKGSIIPLFQKQISQGGPLTVTHPNVERYFMTITEAIGLILESALYAIGGEVFVLDMGQPIKIFDLAEKMIKLAGLKPNEDIKIEIIGLRPGEKLKEELFIENNPKKINNLGIYVEKNYDLNYQKIDFDNLFENYENLTNKEIKDKISKMIISYNKEG